MDRSGVLTLVALGLILLVATVYFIQVREANEQAEVAASPAATVLAETSRYTDINGEPISLSNYVGQTVVAVAWATWCPVCGEQLQELAALAEAYPEVVILAFNRAETVATAQSYLEFYDLELEVELVMDPDDHFFSSIEGYTMPETVIYDSRGNVIHHKHGYTTVDELTSLLRAVE